MQKCIVVIGVGEMAGVFARGFLKAGYKVIPVTRDMPIQQVAEQTPEPACTLVSVGEKDLQATLRNLPPVWQTNLVLLQNELLPPDWQAHNLIAPTIISVWFEKKKGQDYKVLIPSPIYGPNAKLIASTLATLDIPSQVLDSSDQLLFELVRKNVYILTTNIAGLVVGSTVDKLWSQHRELATIVANEIIDIQDYLTATTNNRTALMEGMVTAINGDPEHKCMGRSAPTRLTNALAHADQANLAVPKLREIFLQTREIQ